MRGVTGLLAGLVLAACAQDVDGPTAEPATRIVLDGQGATTGYVADTGAHVWLGLPYAAPPVGDLRWRATRPASGWDGERDATRHASRCPQITNVLDEPEGLEPGLLAGEEDCLYLDIYAPPGADELPVMVWIHGGSNVWGRSSEYDGSQLAIDQNVIIVAVQYRLGPLGFMSAPELRADAERPEDRAANFAILDLIESLRWVQAHAEDFGGDAGRVTIFGESAGGHNVAALLTSPLAEGLFHRAIIQSGSAATVTRAEAEGRSGDLANASGEVLGRVVEGPVTAEALRAVSLEDVFAGLDLSGGSHYDMPRMIEDGVTVPEGGIRAALASPGTFNAVPVITGTNRDEMRLFNALNPDLASRTLGLFIRPRDRDYYAALSDYQSAMWTVGAVDDLASVMTAGGHDDVWAYRFDWDEGAANLLVDTRFMLGAAHAMEIPFVFNRFELFGRLDPFLFNDRNAEGRVALARQMGRHWADFARDGDPGGGWERWRDGGARMRFDTPADDGPELVTGRTVVADLADALASDARVDNAERCRIARAMGDRFFGDGASVAERLDCPDA
ncbi:carboxylesterase/lipase family protein [Hyphobacterium marinum]|uniref:Carboxylic ester hydrolase n=1 Tax=Hyphobacterium marinum TaxID=3116574 RepID=A0ABU7LVX4_9PROT|nr:carboxylesterase family protein [Hyphobacterium sp. Y6023]MEE2565685.1 carboxylesterase family protein [Hyphobacterium sp. Y6023]